MVLDDIPSMILQFPKLRGTCLQKQLPAFSHPIHIKATEMAVQRMDEYVRYEILHRIVSLNDSTTVAEQIIHTLLTSVNSLNKLILVAHASSCSYPKPVTRRDCSTYNEILLQRVERNSQIN